MFFQVDFPGEIKKLPNFTEYVINEDINLFFDRRNLYINHAKPDCHCLIHSVQISLNAQGFNIDYEKMKDRILNFAISNWQDFIDTAYDEQETFNMNTHSDLENIDQNSEDFLLRQKAIVLCGIEEYISEKKWNLAFGDHICNCN